jgi:hypothetical protein
MGADLARRVTVTQDQAGAEQLGYPTRETDGSPGRRRRHRVGEPQQVVEALLVPGVLEPVVRVTNLIRVIGYQPFPGGDSSSATFFRAASASELRPARW